MFTFQPSRPKGWLGQTRNGARVVSGSRKNKILFDSDLAVKLFGLHRDVDDVVLREHFRAVSLFPALAAEGLACKEKEMNNFLGEFTNAIKHNINS